MKANCHTRGLLHRWESTFSGAASCRDCGLTTERLEDAFQAMLKQLKAVLEIDDGRFFAHESWDDLRDAVRKAEGR